MLITVLAIPQEQAAVDAQAEVKLMWAAQQDPTAFAPLYEAYFERVYAFCRRRSNTDAEAEDLCSQVFVRVLDGLYSYRGGMVAAWLFTIARRVIANHYRGRKPIINLDGIEIPTEDAVSERLERDDDRRILAGLVAALPDDKQTLLSLALDSGLTSKEIGDVVGKSSGSVRVELHRVIKLLRERYFRIVGGHSS